MSSAPASEAWVAALRSRLDALEGRIEKLEREKEHSNKVVAWALLEVASALVQGAAGPTDYWFNRLAERLRERAGKIDPKNEVT